MALFIRPQPADTYVDQLQCRPEILYPQLVHDTPQTEILKKNILHGILAKLEHEELQDRATDR